MDENTPQTRTVDFMAVIKHLQQEGWTQRQLAEWSGISHGRIGQLALQAGAEPRFNAGHALLSLLTPRAHLQLVGYARRRQGTTNIKPPDPRQ
jgi:hypothetical protein